MNEACYALKEPLEEVFRKFAYLDLELRLTGKEFSKKWTLCTRVCCGNAGDLTLILMCSPELAATIANNYLGITEGSRPGQRIDIVSELTNVLAGHAYEIMRGGTRPKKIHPPELLGVRETMELWGLSPAECRFAGCSETEDLCGLLVSARNEWSRP